MSIPAECMPLVVGLPGPTLGADEIDILERVQPAGVILFQRNVESAEQVRELVAHLVELDLRPFVAIDLEGGMVNRLRPIWGELPSPAEAAAAEKGEPERVMVPAGSLDLWLDLETKERSIWGITYRFKVRPGVHTRVTTERVKVNVRLKAALQISMGTRESRRRVMDIDLAVRYRPLRGEVSAELEFVLVRW